MPHPQGETVLRALCDTNDAPPRIRRGIVLFLLMPDRITT
jgi:hypothetical protein